MRRGLAAVVLGLIVAGCAGLLSLDDVGYGSATDAGSDVAGNDAPTDDSGASDDAGRDADASGTNYTYSDMADPLKWTTVSLESLGVGGNGQWVNAVFDGRYVHFGPLITGTDVLSYDVQAKGLTRAVSWRVLPLPARDGGAESQLSGVASVGGKLFVTTVGSTQDQDAVFWRAPGDPVSAGWQTLDLVPIEPVANHGFSGFDERYLYLMPRFRRAGAIPSGVVTRLDPAALPGAAPAVFDLAANLNTFVQGFNDAVYDGRYLYLVPNANAGGPSGVFARYDTKASFTDAGAWDWFDVATLDPTLTQFGCGTFDGRYLYFFNDRGIDRPHATLARYDTRGSFTAPASWRELILIDRDAGTDGGAVDYFGGAAFDGRYVYAIGNDGTLGQSMFLMRIDTTAPIGPQAIQAVPFPAILRLATLPPQLEYTGFAFDGQYLYLVPFLGGIVARFDARTPGPPPPPSSVF